MAENKDKCQHDYTPWVYRDMDNSIWDVTSCILCDHVLSNVENHERDYKDYTPGFNWV